MKHSPGAIRAAEIITGGSYEDKDKQYKTAYGRKTVEGIADIIDREMEQQGKGDNEEERIGERFEVAEIVNGQKYRLNDSQVAEYSSEYDSFIIEDDSWWKGWVRLVDGKKLVRRIDTWFVGYPHR